MKRKAVKENTEKPPKRKVASGTARMNGNTVPGRKYDAGYHPYKLEELAREGLVVKQIIASIGITLNTFYKWIRNYPEFAEAYTRGKEPVDIKVENALLKRALGYEIEETSTEGIKNPKTGEIKGTRIRKTKKHIPPDVGAIQFWLIARKPHIWKQTQKIDLTSKDESIFMPPVIIGAPPTELKNSQL